MKKKVLTYQEIIDYIRSKEIKFEDFAYNNFDLPELGEITEVNSTGGEGEGSYWTRTYHYKTHNVFIEVEGYYSSYYGTDFEEEWDGDVYEVFPKEKTITVYER